MYICIYTYVKFCRTVPTQKIKVHHKVLLDHSGIIVTTLGVVHQMLRGEGGSDPVQSEITSYISVIEAWLCLISKNNCLLTVVS